MVLLPLLRLHPHLLRRGTVSRSVSLTCRWSADVQIVTSCRGASADASPCWCSPSLGLGWNLKHLLAALLLSLASLLHLARLFENQTFTETQSSADW